MNGRQAKLTQLMHTGMQLYPAGMGAMPAEVAPRAPASRPAWIDGDTGRAARNEKTFVPVKRTVAWGSGRAPTPAERQRARQKFVSWLKAKMPKVYALAIQKAGRPPEGTELAGLGAADGETWWQKFADTVVNVGQAALAYKTQKELLEVQLDLAREGKPPLDTTAYQPVIRVGADPEAVQQAFQYAGASVGDMLKRYWFIPAGLIAFMVLRK